MGSSIARLIIRVVIVNRRCLRRLCGARVVFIYAKLMLGADRHNRLLKLGRVYRCGRVKRREACVGAHKNNGRIRQELHDHAYVLVVLREHHGRDGERRAARRMRLGEQLRWSLAEVFYLRLDRLFSYLIVDAFQIHRAFIRQIVEHVAVSDGFRSALFIAEY